MFPQAVSNPLLTNTISGVSPDEAFEREVQPICEAGIEEYLENYEGCTYEFPDGSACVSRPERAHLQHTSRAGEIVPGIFQRRFKWNHGHGKKWMGEIRERYSIEYHRLLERRDSFGVAAAQQRDDHASSSDDRGSVSAHSNVSRSHGDLEPPQELQDVLFLSRWRP